MLQIIGWLGCVYLVVKALEIASNSNARDADGIMRGAAVFAVIIAAAGAIFFAGWLLIQGMEVHRQSSIALSPSRMECIENAASPQDVLAC